MIAIDAREDARGIEGKSDVNDVFTQIFYTRNYVLIAFSAF